MAFLAGVGATIGLVGSILSFSWYYVAVVLAGIGLLRWFGPLGRDAEAGSLELVSMTTQT